MRQKENVPVGNTDIPAKDVKINVFTTNPQEKNINILYEIYS